MNTDFFTVVYVCISLLVVYFDIFTAYKCLGLKRKSSNWLALTCIGAAMVQIAYLVSVFVSSYRAMSVFMSLYFTSVSITVFAFFVFFRIYVRSGFGKREIISFWALIGWLVFDITCNVINTFKEIVVQYYSNGQSVARYSYKMLPVFWVHLIVIYMMLVVTFVNIYKGARRVPKVYRRPFIYSIWMIIVVVAINAAYLYFPSAFGGNALDYSIWGYTIATLMIYHNCYVYADVGMKPFYHSVIVENVNQGVALFDYAGRLTITNAKLLSLLPDLKITDEMPIEDFIKMIGVDINTNRREENYSLQFYNKKDNKNRSIRLDHRGLKSDGEMIGELLVFTDEVGDVDVLTSFYNWEIFKASNEDMPIEENESAIVAVCDINGLGEINNEHGRAVGDRAISLLAESIRKHFPADAHYVRGQEASLIVIVHGMDMEAVNKALVQVQTEVSQQTDINCFINIQSAISIKNAEDNDIVETIKLAFKSLKNKKLLDKKSPKSELVRSLVKALEEVDYGTEEHVKRTQALGYELGKRLGLTDIQLTDLALLCILHDIGKIGIPLNILNKPSKLNDSEWRMMKSHTEKGYQIAMSAKELSDIADMILHHHECWDGRGYPDGLTKESIPLLSRIISVVDAYDAMVNDRPYRKGISTERAIAELKRCAGTQFDPAIVNEFVAMLPEVNTDDVKDETIIMSAQVFEEDEPSVEEADTSNVYTVNYCRYWLDSKNVIVEVNDVFESLTGYSKEDVKTLKLSQNDLLPEEDKVGYAILVNEQISKNSVAYFEHRIKCKNGTIKRVLCFGRLYYDAAVLENRSEIIVVDTASTHAMKAILDEEHTKAQVRLDRWEDKYRTDSLTGILNHESFRSDVDLKLVEGSEKVMLMMLDVDRFKNYNDTYGHKAGDEFLIMIAQNLSSALRSQDLACRMGGDEFACALFYSPSTSDEIMYKRANQIYEKLNYILSADGSGASISAGVVISSDENNTFNKLYETVDRALYDAKESGRECLVIAK